MATNDQIEEARHRMENYKLREAAKAEFLHTETNNVNATIDALHDNDYFRRDQKLSIGRARAALGIELIEQSILDIVRANEWKLTVSDISQKLELDRDDSVGEHRTWLTWDLVRRLLDAERLYRFPGEGRSYLFGTSRAQYMDEERFRQENCRL